MEREKEVGGTMEIEERGLVRWGRKGGEGIQKVVHLVPGG